VLVAEGALRLRGDGTERVKLVAVGGYQLEEALCASARLTEKAIGHAVVYLFEPARFRVPRDEAEAAVLASDATRERLFPSSADVRVLLTHTRPEPLLGVLRPLDTGRGTRALGYINRGGTLDVTGMLRTNRCTWIHAVAAVADALQRSPSELLEPAELALLDPP
jgi:phosphoketolase